MTENEFNVLFYIYKNKNLDSERILLENHNLNIGELKKVLADLNSRSWIAGSEVTSAGYTALKPYKVDNAIMLAAGASSRCLPFSKIIPKGLFRIKGEILLERQIAQLQSAGIKQVILVVGCMKEKFSYLKDKLGVILVENDDFIERNNTHSLFVAREYMKNSYICLSDMYYTRNLFSEYEYDSYYPCTFTDQYVDEYCITKMKDNFIAEIKRGAENCWCTRGHVYFNKTVCEKFIELLKIERDYPEVKKKVYDDFIIKHIDKFLLRVKEVYNEDMVEFDTVKEAIDFDSDFREFIIEKSLND